MVDVKGLAEEYVKASIDLVSLIFLPPSEKRTVFQNRFDDVDDRLGMIREEMTKLDKKGLVDFCKETLRLFHEVGEKSHRLLRPLIEAVALYPPDAMVGKEPYLSLIDEQIVRDKEITTVQRELSRKIIDAFSEDELRRSLTESLKWRDEGELFLASRAAEKGRAKIKGHESCVFIEYDDEESGLSGTIRVG